MGECVRDFRVTLRSVASFRGAREDLEFTRQWAAVFPGPVCFHLEMSSREKNLESNDDTPIIPDPIFSAP